MPSNSEFTLIPAAVAKLCKQDFYFTFSHSTFSPFNFNRDCSVAWHHGIFPKGHFCRDILQDCFAKEVSPG